MRAQQDARANAGPFARYIQAVARAVNEVDVGVPAPQEERAVGWRQTTERMPARIANHVGFGFDDASGDPTVRDASRVFAHQDFPDEVTSQRERVGRQFRATQPAYTQCVHVIGD